ncbi:MAG: sulfate ABC transporter permease subunit CysT, partial [Methylobacter sp.]
MSKSSIMPGFRPTIGFTIVYLSLVVLIPLSTLVLQSFQLSWDDYVHIITNKRVLSSFRVSFVTALAAALVAGFFGFITAWVLVRYSFFG